MFNPEELLKSDLNAKEHATEKFLGSLGLNDSWKTGNPLDVLESQMRLKPLYLIINRSMALYFMECGVEIPKVYKGSQIVFDEKQVVPISCLYTQTDRSEL